MHLDWLFDAFHGRAGRPALVWRERTVTYGELLGLVSRWRETLPRHGIRGGSVVSLEGDYSPAAVALLLALVDTGGVVVPLTAAAGSRRTALRGTAEVEHLCEVDADDRVSVRATGTSAGHPLLRRLRDVGRPGLVLFSSGSTGAAKAVLHDFAALLDKFRTPRRDLRTLAFLLFDHIGGINTLFYTLANGGALVIVPDRLPDTVCAAIARHAVQLLPSSPTFLNLLLASEAYRRHDLSSLELVTYGTEVMPASTLERLHALLPGARLLQTYGLSEVGILRSLSRGSDSLWVKVGGEGFETRVVDGMLQVRAASAMLGYLNAPSPFTDDGWLPTGDLVEVDGEYLRILGRQSEIINVGGEKVYPAEVESVLQAMPGVVDATVAGRPHPLTGQIVTARVRLDTGETLAQFRKRMHAHCRGKLARFKVPQKVELASVDLHGERFKKTRRG